MATDKTSPTPWARVAMIVLSLTLLLSVLLTAFALPAVNSGPHKIPIALVAPAAAAEEFRSTLELSKPGAFEVTSVSDLAAARSLILDRGAYGAFLFDVAGSRVLIATAASPAVARTITQMAGSIGKAQGRDVPIEDVRPLPVGDPNGLGLAVGALPLVLGGWIGGLVIITLIVGSLRQMAGVLALAVVGGLALTAMLQFWFGSIDGPYILTSGAVALGIAATAATVIGLRKALGGPGIAVAAVILILLGNPLSGLNSAPELLPAGWGALGQLLPPGAAGTLLRSVAFFDGARAAMSVIVLASWFAAGMALFVIGEARSRSRGAAVDRTTAVRPAEAAV